MKTAKLTNVTSGEVASIILILGGQRVLYRDAPLLNESQITEVVDEYKAGKCDTVFFDTGAIFDVPAYDLATQVVAALPKPKVVIYNKP